MKKRVINFRTIFVFALMLALGVLYAKDIFSASASAIILIVLLVGFFIAWAVWDKDYKKVVIPIAALIVGIGMFLLSDGLYFKGATCQGVHDVTGRVEYVNNDYQTSQTFVLTDVKVDGVEQNKNIFVKYLKHGTTLDEGNIISFNGNLQKANMWEFGEFNSFYYKNKIVSFCEVSSADVETLKGDKTIGEKFQQSVKDTLEASMTPDNAAIAYASIFGDKVNISEEIRNAFSETGIAHLLAISGLHIGFFVMTISWLLSLCKLHKRWHVLVIAPILILYCILCRFSPSVVRASIMSVVGLIGYSFGRKTDALTTMSFALLIILCIWPMSIFDGGTQLSFLCVFSLIVLSPLFQKLFDKIKLGKIGKVISPILSVQLGILPLSMKLFSGVSVLSILANMVCVPIFEIAYILLMLLLPIAMIIPSASIILVAPEFLINSIAMTALKLSQVKSTISFSYLGKDFSIIFIILSFAISRFLILKPGAKGLAVLSLIMVALTLFYSSRIQFSMPKNSIAMVDYEENYIINSDGKNYLVNLSGVFDENSNLSKVMNHLKVYKINSCIYAKGEADASKWSQTKRSEVVIQNNNNVEFIKLKDKTNCVYFHSKNINVLFVLNVSNIDEKNMIEFALSSKNIDIVVNLTDQSFDLINGMVVDNSDFEKQQNWTICVGCDKLGLKRRMA